MKVFLEFFRKKKQAQAPSDPLGWWGRTTVHLAVGRQGLIVVFFGLFLCVALVLTYGQYARKVQVEGVLEPRGGQSILLAPDNGMLRSIQVRPGDQVHAGDVIAEISVLRKTIANDAAGGEVAALRRSIDGFRSTSNLHEQDRRILSTATSDQLRLLNNETEQVQQELRKNLQAEQSSGAELSKLKTLVAEGIRPTHELANSEIEYFRLTNESARARQNITRIEGRKVELKAQLQREQTALTRQGNETSTRLNQLDVELNRALKGESFHINATRDGVVDSIFSQLGAQVQSGEIVAAISDPEAPIQALMFIRASEIGFVRLGDTVQLQIDAFPTQQFGSIAGKIIEISSTAATNSQFKKLANLKEGDRSYMAVVSLEKTSMTGYGDHWKLRAGMTYRGYVALERQSLFRWLFNPVFVALGRNPYFFDQLRESK